MAPTHNEIGLRLLIGPRRIQGLALKTGADSAVPERDQVRVVGPALGVCRCHRRRPKKQAGWVLQRRRGSCSGVGGIKKGGPAMTQKNATTKLSRETRAKWVGFSQLPGSLSGCRFAGDIGGTGHIFTNRLPTDYQRG